MTPTDVSRRELQPLIDNAIQAALKDAEITMTPDHKRRLVRVLMRSAARIAQSEGTLPPHFTHLADGAYRDEMPETALEAIAKASPFMPGIIGQA